MEGLPFFIYILVPIKIASNIILSFFYVYNSI
jgi:hypothetical protein